jgi:hypothetical protein
MAVPNRLRHRPVLPRRIRVPWGECPPVVHPEAIPDQQRAALAWRLRDALARADLRAAKYSAYPTRREQVRVDNLRGEVLGLVDELETGTTQQRKG